MSVMKNHAAVSRLPETLSAVESTNIGSTATSKTSLTEPSLSATGCPLRSAPQSRCRWSLAAYPAALAKR
eukprot:2705438-Rhodomonas_salina.2